MGTGASVAHGPLEVDEDWAPRSFSVGIFGQEHSLIVYQHITIVFV